MRTGDQLIKRYTYQIRLWHWLNAIIIFGLLLTVLINHILFSVDEQTANIKEMLKNTGAIVSTTQARAVAHGMEDKVWDLHIYLGYALATLFLYRICHEVLTKSSTSFVANLQKTWRVYLTKKVKSTRHELAIKILYLFFYGLLLVMVLTGLSISFDDELGAAKAYRHGLKEIHGFCMYLILGFILLHLIGVFLGELKDKKGIVSAMISGGN